MFIKIELQNKGSNTMCVEQNSSTLIPPLYAYMKNQIEIIQKPKEQKVQNTITQFSCNKSLSFFFNLQTENKLNGVEINIIHTLCPQSTQTFICDITLLYPFFLRKQQYVFNTCL